MNSYKQNLILTLLFMNTWMAMAGPMHLNYQGKLFGQDGKPVNGPAQIAVKIYSAAESGALVHQETIGQVIVNDGICSFLWGASGITNHLDFSSELWVELIVNGEVLLPRQILVAVPYSMIAREAMDVPDGAITGSKIANASLTGAHFGSNVLINGSITAKSFSGDGSGLTNINPANIDGPISGGTSWGPSPTNSFIAKANVGYVTAWDRDTQVTLPANPKIGDTLGVVGAGTGTWRILQNQGQFILSSQNGLLLNAGSEISVTNEPFFSSLAISSNGAQMVAANGFDPWISQNGGASWIRPQLIRNRMNEWSRFTLSPDGGILMAQGRYNEMTTNQMLQMKEGLFFSRDDGAQWSQIFTNNTTQNDNIATYFLANTGSFVYLVQNSIMAPTHGTNLILKSAGLSSSWTVVMASTNTISDLAVSDDGIQLMALIQHDWMSSSIHLSKNRGDLWTNIVFTNEFRYSGVSSSSEGKTIVITENSGSSMMISTNYGLNWSSRTLSNAASRKVAVSGNGRLLFLESSGQVYWTENNGLNWWPLNVPVNGDIEGFAASSDGEIMIRPSSYGKAYVTLNGGRIWYEKTVDTNSWDYFRYLVMSRNGQKTIIGSNSAGGPGDHYLFQTSDKGETWSRVDLSKLYIDKIALSADGSKLLGFNMSMGNFMRSVDSGLSWVNIPTNLSMMTHIESSRTGSRFMALESEGVFISDDSGNNWSNIFRGSFTGASMSDDGLIFYAYGNSINMDDPMQNKTGLFSSRSSVSNWNLVIEQSMLNNMGPAAYGGYELNVSGNGIVLVLSEKDYMGFDPIIISTNAGDSWFLGPVISNNAPVISVNGDGRVIGINQSHQRYNPHNYTHEQIRELKISTDYGRSWSTTSAETNILTRSLALSGDGRKLVVSSSLEHQYSGTHTLRVIELNRPDSDGFALEGEGSAKIQLIYVGNGAWDILFKSGLINAFY